MSQGRLPLCFPVSMMLIVATKSRLDCTMSSFAHCLFIPKDPWSPLSTLCIPRKLRHRMPLLSWVPTLSALDFPPAPANLSPGTQGLRRRGGSGLTISGTLNSRHTAGLPCLIWRAFGKRQGSVLKE